MSKIEWTDRAWNVVHGCTKVSAGCTNCYAEVMARRLAGQHGYPEAPNHFDVTLRPDRLNEPQAWRKPWRVFVCSMGDLFHDAVPYSFIDNVFRTIYLADHNMRQASREPHTWQILTKRPERMVHYFKVGSFPTTDRKGARRGGGFTEPLPPNIWLGVTAENQAEADVRIPHLLNTPAAVHFVSVEPMLGPVDLGYGKSWIYQRQGASMFPLSLISWVIIGCESGPRRRPMELEWAGDLVAQCQAANVPVFVKQLPINGLASHDPTEWPEALRVREWPEART